MFILSSLYIHFHGQGGSVTVLQDVCVSEFALQLRHSQVCSLFSVCVLLLGIEPLPLSWFCSSSLLVVGWAAVGSVVCAV